MSQFLHFHSKKPKISGTWFERLDEFRLAEQRDVYSSSCPRTERNFRFVDGKIRHDPSMTGETRGAVCNAEGKGRSSIKQKAFFSGEKVIFPYFHGPNHWPETSTLSSLRGRIWDRNKQSRWAAGQTRLWIWIEKTNKNNGVGWLQFVAAVIRKFEQRKSKRKRRGRGGRKRREKKVEKRGRRKR